LFEFALAKPPGTQMFCLQALFFVFFAALREATLTGLWIEG
jgi:hypothetical protein